MHVPLGPAVLLVAALALLFGPHGAIGQTCVDIIDKANTTLLCPELENITRPTQAVLFNGTLQVLPDLPEFYAGLSEVICKECHGYAKKQFVCSLIAMYYTRNGGCRVAGQSVALPCLTDCKGAEVKCKDKRSDATNGTYVESIVCGTNVLNDNTGCVKNRNNDFCRRPPFLLRKTAGAPNWVWVFIVGLGGLILIIIIVAVVIMCLKLETFMTVINPCKWCECCPGYYDL